MYHAYRTYLGELYMIEPIRVKDHVLATTLGFSFALRLWRKADVQTDRLALRLQFRDKSSKSGFMSITPYGQSDVLKYNVSELRRRRENDVDEVVIFPECKYEYVDRDEGTIRLSVNGLYLDVCQRKGGSFLDVCQREGVGHAQGLRWSEPSERDSQIWRITPLFSDAELKLLPDPVDFGAQLAAVSPEQQKTMHARASIPARREAP